MHPKAGKQGARPNQIVCFETRSAPEVKRGEATIYMLDGVVNSPDYLPVRFIGQPPALAALLEPSGPSPSVLMLMRNLLRLRAAGDGDLVLWWIVAAFCAMNSVGIVSLFLQGLPSEASAE